MAKSTGGRSQQKNKTIPKRTSIGKSKNSRPKNKHKKGVEKALRDYSNKRVTKRSWDEQLVNQFTIEKIHLLKTQGGVSTVEMFIHIYDILKKSRIPVKDWKNDSPGLATYIKQVGKAEMRTMGTK